MEQIETLCVLCDQALNDPLKYKTYHEKAVASLRSASIKRKDFKYKKWSGKVSIIVHNSCYVSYTRGSSIKNARERSKSTSSNSTDSNSDAQSFDFANNCFFCGDSADDAYIQKIVKSGPAYKKVRFVSKESTKVNILALTDQFKNISQDMKVINERIKDVDLLAIQARYHNHCFSRFYSYEIRSNVKGRPITERTADIIEFISNYIQENPDECQYSLKQLIEKYQSLTECNDKPNLKNLKEQLLKFFGNEIRIYQSNNDYHLVFLDCIDDILTKAFHSDKCKNETDEEERIVSLAAYIILKKIRLQHYDLDHYPKPSEFLNGVDEQTPTLLQKFLNILICSGKNPNVANKKVLNHRVTMFSHAIVASARPRSFISPLLLGVSTLMHRKHASRTLIDCLAHLGLAESYHETVRFENCVSSQPEKYRLDNSYIQMVWDNVDHNTNTIDGKNTFHATAGIMCVTPGSSVVMDEKIDRTTKKSAFNGQFGFTPIKEFIKPKNSGLNNIIIQKINSSKETFMVDITEVDFLWSFNKSDKCPGWNGFHEICAPKDQPYDTSKIIPLNIINAPITQYEAILTLLLESSDRCKANKQSHIFVTFDLPPYQKATEVIACLKGTPLEEKLSCVILRLGALHITFSFMGSIGYIMGGSGINEAFSQIFAENSVDKIMSGHAYSRAVRGHILVQKALNKIIIDMINLKDEEITKLTEIIDAIGTGIFYELIEQTEFRNIYNKFKEQVKLLEEHGPTTKLWLQYLRMVEILKLFIEAERTGNWALHLRAARLMLPYLIAAGHTAYAKYLLLYLQQMEELEKKMDIFEFEKFTEGYFTIRRSDKYRSGIATDMTIEQKFMRLFKSESGVTRGRGMYESMLVRWITSAIALINVIDEMEKYCNVQYQTSEQHVDTSNARISRDASDLKKISAFFSIHNPFPKTDNIMSITTGVIGNESINCHEAFEKGFEALDRMHGPFGLIKMDRKNKIVSLKAATSAVKIDGEIIPIDSSLIYQRMICNIECENDRKKYLSFELAPFPLSMFKDGLMRKSPKAKLYDLFSESSDALPTTDLVYVIDGGLLLHKVVWNESKIIGDIIKLYVDYLMKLKGEKVVVFDGYDNNNASSTKHYERLRRENKNVCCEIKIDNNTKLTVKQEQFLSNGKNKKQLISLLCNEFNKNTIETAIAIEDADTLIIKKAIEKKKENTGSNVIVWAEDVDLLVLLTHFADKNFPISYLKPSRGNIKQKYFTSHSFKHQSLQSLLLFIHAMSGCDTTSAFHNKGKVKIVDLLLKDPSLRKIAETFYDDEANSNDIGKQGCEIIRRLYSTQKDKENLTQLRYKKFKSAKTKTAVKLETLPPTEAAASQHCLRVYHQLQKWLGNDKEASEWGWCLSGGVLKPNYSKEPLIPDDLLFQVSCKCQTGCKTKICSCRKNGVQCTQLCVNCDANCTNCITVQLDENTFNLDAEEDVESSVEDDFENCEEQSEFEDSEGDEEDSELDSDKSNSEDSDDSDMSEAVDNVINNSVNDRKRQHSQERSNQSVSAVKKKII